MSTEVNVGRIEDASGMDLNWFWRGWFFGTDHVDIALENVKWYKINIGEPEMDKAIEQEKENRLPERYISNIRNKKEIKETAVEKDDLDQKRGAIERISEKNEGDLSHGPRKTKRRIFKSFVFSELEMRYSTRTHDSGSWNRGSNPCFPATLKIPLFRGGPAKFLFH